jgi:hypothetical protein
VSSTEEIDPYGLPRAVSLKTPGVRERRDDWGFQHDRCMVCWIHARDAAKHRFPGGLQTHEIIGGAMRSMEPCNYLRICAACHKHYHDGNPTEGLCLDLGTILYCKYEWSCIELGGHFSPNWIVEASTNLIAEQSWNWHRLAALYRPQRRPLSAACLPCMESPSDRYLEERLRWNPGLRSPLPLGLKPSHKLEPAQYSAENDGGILRLRKLVGSATCFPPSLNANGVLGSIFRAFDWNSMFSLTDLRNTPALPSRT